MTSHGHHLDDDAAAPMAVNTTTDDRYHDRGTNSIRSIDDGVMEEYSEKPPPPPRRRFYKQKRYWIICSVITVIIVVVVVLLIIYVFFPMIAQSLINKAGIEVGDAQITFSPPDNLSSQKRQTYNMNETFFMNMTSKLTNTGPFSADITFHNPIEVYYNDTILGTITLPSAHVSGGSGQLKAFTPFYINNTEFFASFSKDMLADKTFTWRMKGKLDISALSRTATIDLDKEIVLNGMDGFPEVKITSFQLPSDAAQGGINVELGTELTSPSPIGVQLGTIVLNVGYQGLYLGQVSASNVNLVQGANNILLKGVLVPQSDPAALAKVSELFSNYVSGKISQTTATGVSCAPDGVNAITWLSEGFRSVQLNVGLGNSEPLNIIQGVSMGYLDLKFSTDAPYAPVSSAPNVIADFTIPFGFSLNITQVSQNLTIGTNDTGNFATLSVPWVQAQSDQKAGKLQFAMSNIPIVGMSGKESQYDDFTYALTASDAYWFQVGGNASTITETPIGQVTLSGISFEVPTTLHGLQFLNSTPTEVLGVDVTGGTTDNLLLSINVSMTNPSDINITAGNVQFAFLASGEQLGNVMLTDLTLVRGPNQLTASSTFNPKGSQVGSNLLSTFVMGQNNAVSIAGNSESTAIKSLVKAFSAITIDTSLPGLKQQLIQGAKLTVNTDSAQNGIVGVAVSIANPFTASLTITKVVSAATYQGMPVGNIDQDISSSPIVIGGHSTVQSNPLNMQMNIEPAAVSLLLRQLAVAEGLDTRPLDALLGMGGFHIAGQEDVSPSADLFANFNISQYVMQAMQALHADLQLLSTLTVGEYTTDLQFAQNNVAVQTDETVTRLIPIVGQPIVQQLVDGATLGFETIVLSSPTDTSFQVQMKGSITGTGPFSAKISFPSPLTISWQGKNIVSVNMPEIQTQPDVGATFDVTASSTVLDQSAMGEFAGYLINNENFQWEITTNDVAVNALGYTFTNISMDKFVTLDGANGFKDAVKILSFDLPANDPAGGITLTANTTITNPSQVGFTLNGASFAAYYKDVYLGPLASDGQAIFPPKGTGNIAMKGRMVPQDSQEGLDAVTEVFENYLSAKDTPLEVKGVSGSGPQGEVGWLTTGFKTVDIENVILPGPDTPPELIPSITMMDMELDFTKNEWAPPAGSKEVQAQLKNPFGFPLGVKQLNMDVTVSYGGTDTAQLKVPDEPATTSSTGVVTTSFSDIPLSVFDDAHSTFSSFVKSLTAESNVTFGLAGSTNAVTETAIGTLKLNNITFDVDTALAGFANFGGKNDILSLSVTGGTSEYIIISLTIGLNNPSRITAGLGDLMLTVQMNEFNTAVGNVYLKSVTMQPGNNTFEAEMHMGEDSSNEQALKQLLSDYMTGATVPLTILGSEKSTSIEPLQQAMSTVKLATSMTGIPNTLVIDTTVYADLVTLLLTNRADCTVTLQNPLKTQFAITKIQAEVYATELGTTFKVGTIDYSLPSPFTVQPGSQATSDKWPVSVNLDLNNIGPLLALILDPNAKVDLTQNATIIVGDGFNSVLYYYQSSVPCKIVTDGVSLQKSFSSKDSNPLSQLPSDMINAIPSNILSQLGFSAPTSSAAAAASSAASQAQSAVSAGASAAASAADNVASGVKSAVSDILPDKTTTTTPAPAPTSDSSDSSSDGESSSSSSEEAKATTTSSSSDGPHFLWPFKI